MPESLCALALPACPMAVGAMMWMMMRGQRAEPSGNAAKGAELAALQVQIGQLHAAQRDHKQSGAPPADDSLCRVEGVPARGLSSTPFRAGVRQYALSVSGHLLRLSREGRTRARSASFNCALLGVTSGSLAERSPDPASANLRQRSLIIAKRPVPAPLEAMPADSLLTSNARAGPVVTHEPGPDLRFYS